MDTDIEEMTVETEEDTPSEVVEEELTFETPWTDLFFNYWFLWIIVTVSALYVYHSYIAPAIEKYMHERADRELEAKLHKNPDLLRARQEAMLKARMRMQEQHDSEAARKAELRKAREEKKKQEMLSKQTGIYANIGTRLNDTAGPRNGNTPQSNRTEYNPLTGSGSAGYRPPRRSCPGGGCG